ncbi:magnesium chelatase [bacterium DOLZORAL124_64_63]|nr:MAG: magnesium chelatase [bacterium DOLZORAL124_64_63]
MDYEQLTELTEKIRMQVHRVVLGQDDVIDLMLVALLCDGHVLLEGVPGTAKTLLARVFAGTLNLNFRRIQFTPDLMPGDVLGTNLFNFQTSSFTLTKGPIFTDILLADEINRTPPKTQAALLESMQERSVTIDGKSYTLGQDFMVIATQNPIEQQGIYPLPEAQLDRFLFKILVGYPDQQQEKEMVMLHGHTSSMPSLAEFAIEQEANGAVLAQARDLVAQIRLNEDLVDYIVNLVRATRETPALLCGASPRSANMLAVASRARAALEGRTFVIPDDVKNLARPILRHRLPLAPGAEIEGTTVEKVVSEIIDQVPVPR